MRMESPKVGFVRISRRKVLDNSQGGSSPATVGAWAPQGVDKDGFAVVPYTGKLSGPEGPESVSREGSSVTSEADPVVYLIGEFPALSPGERTFVHMCIHQCVVHVGACSAELR
jgi:hypothetical protein